jgi:hypothetical protein
MTEIENMERIGHAMMLAWGRIKRTRDRMWGEWMTIGEGLLEGRRWAMRQAGTNKPEGRGYVVAYAEWLKRYKVDDMDKSDRAKLLQLMEERPAVEEWRSSLPASERHNLNNPTIAWRKWMAATRVTKPKPRTAPVSSVEHGRARIIIEELQARNAELQEELETARVKPRAEDAKPNGAAAANSKAAKYARETAKDLAICFDDELPPGLGIKIGRAHDRLLALAAYLETGRLP